MLQLYPPLLLIFFATLLSGLIVLYCLDYIRRYGATQQVVAFTLLAIAAGVWALLAMVELTATSYETSLLAYKLLHFGAFGTAVPLLVYALTIGGGSEWVNRSTVGLLTLTLAPFFVVLFVAPEPYVVVDPRLETLGTFSVIGHGYGVFYYVYLGWVYLLVTVALGYIAWHALTEETLPHTQAGILGIAVLVPLSMSVFQAVGFAGLDTPGTILTPLSLSLSVCGFGYATFRYDTFDAKSRARSRTIEEMQEGYLLVDPDGRIIDSNSAARDFFGAETDLRGVSIGTVLPEYRDQRPGEDSPVSMFETRVETENDTLTLEISVSGLVHNGQSIGELCILRDITERNQYQRKLEAQRDKLELLNAVVRHDIRNHIDLVTGYTDMLENEGLVDEGGREYLEKVRTNAENAIDLTTQARVLAEAMVQTGDELEGVPLAPALSHTIDEVERSFEGAEIRVDGTIPDTAVTANDLLASLFRNVLENAVQHNDEPTPEILVSVEENTDSVRVRVADNGPGVPETHRQALTGRPQSGLETDGTGLGLTLVQTLADLYDGEVRIEDDEPEGAVITVELAKADRA